MTTAMSVAERPATAALQGVHRIVLPKRFDVHEVAQFESATDPLVAAGCMLVVDASEVRYLDQRGMDSLIEARLRCIDRGGDLVLATPSAAARIILELSGRYEALSPIEAAPAEVRAA